MPIQLSCPHCGKQTTVADQYAGQASWCAACAKPITVPFPAGGASYSYGAAKPASGVTAGAGIGVGAIVLISLGALVVCGGILGVMAALVLPALQQSRDAARRVHSSNNMRQILIALHDYHDHYNCFPPAVMKDKDGKPLYSGMVCLLPLLEQGPLSERFQRDKPWDAPENLPISNMNLSIFQDPANNNAVAGRTDYLLISGPGSILDDARGVKRSMVEVRDGMSKTIILMEVKGNASWAAPNTWDLSKPLDGNHPGVVLIGVADGSVHTIRRDISPETVRRLVQRNDGEPIDDF